MFEKKGKLILLEEFQMYVFRILKSGDLILEEQKYFKNMSMHSVLRERFKIQFMALVEGKPYLQDLKNLRDFPEGDNLKTIKNCRQCLKHRVIVQNPGYVQGQQKRKLFLIKGSKLKEIGKIAFSAREQNINNENNQRFSTNKTFFLHAESESPNITFDCRKFSYRRIQSFEYLHKPQFDLQTFHKNLKPLCFLLTCQQRKAGNVLQFYVASMQSAKLTYMKDLKAKPGEKYSVRKLVRTEVLKNGSLRYTLVDKDRNYKITRILVPFK